MAKSPGAKSLNLRRVAKRRRAAPRPPTDEGLREKVLALHQALDKARVIFARLASLRAADMVLFQGKSWDDGAAYINMEMASLDQHLGIETT